MQLPRELTTVTTLSKTVALIMFISLPIIAFLFGMRYQTMISEQNSLIPPVIRPTSAPISCTMDAKLCPDGTSVGRIKPNCEFAFCPTLVPTISNNENIFCGGIAGKLCPSGYDCKYEGTYPDARGMCIKTIEIKSTYICPENGWVNCMPMLTEKGKKNCSSEAIEWYKANCPNFKGAAY